MPVSTRLKHTEDIHAHLDRLLDLFKPVANGIGLVDDLEDRIAHGGLV